MISPKVIKAIDAPSGPAATSGHWAHGHTYVGHPVACAGALEVQRIIEERALGARAKGMGRRLEEGL